MHTTVECKMYICYGEQQVKPQKVKHGIKVIILLLGLDTRECEAGIHTESLYIARLVRVCKRTELIEWIEHI